MLRQCKCICANLIQVRIHSRFFFWQRPIPWCPIHCLSGGVLHFAFNNTKVALCTIAKKTRVTTVKDTQTDLNILVMRLTERPSYQCSTVTQSCLVLLWRKENCCPYASNNTCHNSPIYDECQSQ